MTYWEKLKDPRWQRKRLEIMDRDGFACQLCQAEDKTPNVHHRWYEKGLDPWEYPDRALSTLCEACHLDMHRAKLALDMAVYNFSPRSLELLADGIEQIRDSCEDLELSRDRLYSWMASAAGFTAGGESIPAPRLSIEDRFAKMKEMLRAK